MNLVRSCSGRAALAVVSALVVSATLSLGAYAQPTTFTSPIDVTGARLQLHLAAPDRNTQKIIDVNLPTNMLPPQLAKYFTTPVNILGDQYWSQDVDPRTRKTRRQTICDELQAKVTNLNKKLPGGVRLVAMCNLATNGDALVKRQGDTLQIAYQLRNNKVTVRVNTPLTCNPKGHELFCPDDPQVTVQFAAQLVTTAQMPTLCTMRGDNGKVTLSAITINGDTSLTSAALTAVRTLLPNKAFPLMEEAIREQVERTEKLPIADFFNAIRESSFCNARARGVSRVMTAFPKVDVEFDLRRKAIIFRSTHIGIEPPRISAPNSGGAPTTPTTSSTPSFISPRISAFPTVKAGSTLEIQGRDYPHDLNLSTSLPVTIKHGGYGPNSIIALCAPRSEVAVGTDISWGPVGHSKTTHLPGNHLGYCDPDFQATNLTPGTTYEFKARDCDVVTCSPWSAPLRVTTARSGSNRSVSLSLDNKVSLGTTTLDTKGLFNANVTIPANTALGKHTIVAVNGSSRTSTSFQVVSATTAQKASIKTLTYSPTCNGSPFNELPVKDEVTVLGSGLPPGAISIRVNSVTGFLMGTATVGANGTLCALMKTPSNPDKVTIVAISNGAVVASQPATFIRPNILH